MREAPSRTLMEGLWARGATVRAYDPAARTAAHVLYADESRLTLCDERDATLDGADALVVITEWNEFRSPDFQIIKSRLAEPVIFDGRNLYDPDYLGELGFAYYAIGRGLGDRGL
jgi:UDPglucose 6-dehydrogenase